MNDNKSTTDYDIFIFTKNNREKIDEGNIRKIMNSLRSRNLMHLKPVLVNGQMEVIDGQHRIIAAKRLGIPVFYKIDRTLNSEDIILMNNQKAWGMCDYFNFYLEARNPEYLKLKEFMKKNELSLKIALHLTMGAGRVAKQTFKDGKYKFETEIFSENFQAAWCVIDLIKRIGVGSKQWTESSKFWKALLILVNHDNFVLEKFISNAEKKAERFGARATIQDYFRMFESIANGRSNLRISLSKDDEE